MTQHTCPDGRHVKLNAWPCPFCNMRQTEQPDEQLLKPKKKEKKS